MANLGQLKLCFDLPLTEDSETPSDGLPDLWEYAVVHANAPGGPWSDIGLIHTGNAAQAAAETGMTDPPDNETSVDKSDWETPDWFTLTGNGDEDVKISQTRTFTIKKGKSRMVVVGMASEEYPFWTTNQSEYNDLLEWDITSSLGDDIVDSVDVNQLHLEWDLASLEGTSLQGLSPAHWEKIAVVNAPGEDEVTVTVKLTVTNIGDDDLPSTLMVGLIPVEVADNKFATGVDDVSKTADSTDIGFQKDFWIMAPSGSPPTGVGICEKDTKLFIPVDGSIELGIKADKATANPDKIHLITEDDPATHDTDETLTKVTWHGTSVESGENAVEWEFGTNVPEQHLLPIKVMTMKKRTVKVAVHFVNLFKNGTVQTLDPLMIPSEKGLEAHLNEIFATQINAWFEVKIDKNSDGSTKFYEVDPGTDGISTFDFQSNETVSTDQQKTLDEVGSSPNANLSVFVIANEGTFLVQNQVLAYGFTNRSAATCWVLGRQAGSYNDTKDVMATIGHEIGHVLVGYGHPDKDIGGPAPLVGTDWTVRLMCSHPNRSQKNGRLLVKCEWEAAEIWLDREVDNEVP